MNYNKNNLQAERTFNVYISDIKYVNLINRINRIDMSIYIIDVYEFKFIRVVVCDNFSSA